jgi:short-subunit dehydrogenase
VDQRLCVAPDGDLFRAIKAGAVAVWTSVFDLEAVEEIPQLAEAVVAQRAPTLLVNNAGVGLGGEFRQLDLQEFDSVLRINFRAAVGLTHALLPALLRSPGGHMVRPT